MRHRVLLSVAMAATFLLIASAAYAAKLPDNCRNQLATCQSDLTRAQACGNGIIDSGEDCDLGNLNGKTCATEGLYGIGLACGAGCAFDTSGCYATRFDASGATIIDHQTGLEWEKKDSADGVADLSNPHDADNGYAWCTAGAEGCAVASNPPDGPLFTNFVASLNGAFDSGCYAGRCDWRVPTTEELSTIVIPYPTCFWACVVDDAFLPTSWGFYWSSITHPYTWNAYLLQFGDGSWEWGHKINAWYVRAVRGGL